MDSGERSGAEEETAGGLRGWDLAGHLSPQAVALYKLAIAEPGWDRREAGRSLRLTETELDQAIALLEGLSLLRPSLDPDREYDAISPEGAVAQLLAAEETELRQRQFVYDRVRRDLMTLSTTYFEARRKRRQVEAIDVIDDVDMVNHILSDYARRCRRELHITHPGSGMADDGLQRSLALDLMMLNQGVKLRSVLQHSTRNHPPTRRYVEAVSRVGALVRTTPIVPRRLIVFDREIAFIPPADGDPSGGAILVREPAVVGHLLANFDLIWHAASPFPLKDGESAGESDVATDEIVQSILAQMATGAKDEMIARKLGISVRTCRRYVAEMMHLLGAESRFQAGVLASSRGLLRQEDGVVGGLLSGEESVV